ncbi:Decarbamoylnovobiocin carbamoyltransferase [compost metagenome]
MKDRINLKVKFREDFRPFAPVVTFEDQFKIFNLKQTSPYMLFATQINNEFETQLPSITHVDNTSRIQAIKMSEDSFVHSLLKEFEKLSGFPVLINTSFNIAGEPIVEAPLEAIQTFLKTDIDVLVIENYLLTKLD